MRTKMGFGALVRITATLRLKKKEKKRNQESPLLLFSILNPRAMEKFIYIKSLANEIEFFLFSVLLHILRTQMPTSQSNT